MGVCVYYILFHILLHYIILNYMLIHYIISYHIIPYYIVLYIYYLYVCVCAICLCACNNYLKPRNRCANRLPKPLERHRLVGSAPDRAERTAFGEASRLNLILFKLT